MDKYFLKIPENIWGNMVPMLFFKERLCYNRFAYFTAFMKMPPEMF